MYFLSMAQPSLAEAIIDPVRRTALP